eukprot:s8126_g1.t1
MAVLTTLTSLVAHGKYLCICSEEGSVRASELSYATVVTMVMVVRAAQDSEENRLWQRAFEVERERAELLGLHIRERINRMKGSAKLRLLRDSLHQKVQKVPELASQVMGLVDIIEEGLRNEASASSESTGSRLHEKVAVITVAAMLGDMFTRNIEPDIQ